MTIRTSNLLIRSQVNTPTEHRSKEEIASHDARWLNTVTRRFSDETGERAKRTAPDRTAKARRTRFDETLHDALLIGDKHGVRNLLQELRSLPAPAREAFLKSVKAGVRARQPIRVGSTAGEERRALFLRWAKQRLSAKELARVRRIDAAYRDTARAAGLMSEQRDNVDIEEAIRKQMIRRELSNSRLNCRRPG